MLLQAAARARTRAARGTKSINIALGEIDVSAANASLKSLNGEQTALINVLKAGGGYAKVELAAFDKIVSTECDN